MGYVFSGGVLVAAGDARSVEAVRFSRGCAAGTATPRLHVDGNGVFRFTGRLSGTVSVTLLGKFLDAIHASLRIQFQGVGCSTQPLQVTARLN
jgi:hypothetical protein